MDLTVLRHIRQRTRDRIDVTAIRRIRRRLGAVPFYALLITITILCLLPFIWTVSTSIKANTEVFSYPPVFIRIPPSLEGYKKAANDPLTLSSLLNSVWLTSVSTVVVVAVSAVSAYGMSRFAYRGKGSLRAAILITQMLPPVFVLVPYLQLVAALGIHNTYGGLLLGWCTFGVPFATMMLHGFFNTIPVELDEAAMIDGCNRVQALFRVVLPVSLPGLLGTAAVIFVSVWGDLLLVLIMTRDTALWTLVALISQQLNMFHQFWNQLAVTALLATVPLVLIWAFGQRYVVRGLTAGLGK
jgi:multiple sugar transport system permease protein